MIGFSDNTQSGPTPTQILEQVDAIFKAQGWLQDHLNMDFRPQQTDMAIRVAQSMVADQSILFEAGTGVGKSLAYLLPGIIQAMSNGRKLIVSSHTISLQEQVLNKDLKTCRSLFAKEPKLSEFAKFKATLLIGKGNYLCPQRLSRAIKDKTELFANSDSNELGRIKEWAKSTQTGIIQELYPQPKIDVWDWISADSSQCNRRNCSPETCFYQKAKEQVNQSNVLILNHALLFALLGAGMSPGKNSRGILYPDDFLVLDEGHTVPDIATDHFGMALTNVGLNRLLSQLFNRKTGKGLLSKYHRNYVNQAVVDVGDIAQEFFDHIQYQFLSEKNVVRLHQPNWMEDNLSPRLQALAETLGGLAQKEQNEQAEAEIKDYRGRVLRYRNAISEAIGLAQDDHVYWLERTGKKRGNTALRSAPIDVGPYLRDSLLTRKTSCTFTSATLQDAEGMDRFAIKCGASGIDNEAVTSPFDYPSQMAINIAADCPPMDPHKKTMETEFLADSIVFAASKLKGGTMVLFTSYMEMNRVADKISKDIQKQGRKLYVQGEGLSRSQLVEAFKKDGNAVLFGTDSFWTGVDIPGKALSQVILARLPFENPSHPVLAARSDACIERGEKPFFELTLPSAQIKFRQGLGRLIRNHSDRGVLTILDSRILKKTYGKAFISMLPHPNFTTFTRFNRQEKFKTIQQDHGFPENRA